MRKLISLLIIVAFGAAGMSSCKKYDDGPSLSLRSKTARLSREWKVQKVTEVVTVDEIDLTHVWEDLEYTFNKDGTYIRVNNEVTSNGKWEFGDDKEKLHLKPENSNIAELYTIRRLTTSDLWWDSFVAGKTTKFKFIPKE